MNENNVQTEDVEETVNKHTDKTGDGEGTFNDRMNMYTVKTENVEQAAEGDNIDI